MDKATVTGTGLDTLPVVRADWDLRQATSTHWPLPMLYDDVRHTSTQ